MANAITNEAQQRAILLSTVGQSTYQAFRELTYPKKPKEHKFIELCDLMRKHLKPTVPSMAVERVKFHASVRNDNQSIADYVTSLKKLDDELRDRLLCGVNDSRMRNKMLDVELSELTFDKTFKICQRVELNDRQTKTLPLDTGGATGVNHKLSVSRNNHARDNGNSKKCYRCLSADHLADTCPH